MSWIKNPGRFAGLLYLLTSIIGAFAMGYVPSKLIVDGNAAATASNITAHEMLFRLGIAGELIGQVGFIFVALALYSFLKGKMNLFAHCSRVCLVGACLTAFAGGIDWQAREVWKHTARHSHAPWSYYYNTSNIQLLDGMFNRCRCPDLPE